jgi:hypothetical protein
VGEGISLSAVSSEGRLSARGIHALSGDAPKSTMRRIKGRSMAHLYRLTPENLYEGAGLAAGPEHYQAVAEPLRAAGFDPATVDHRSGRTVEPISDADL